MLDFLKKLLGKTPAPKGEPARRISVAPGQSQEEQDATRSRMEDEMNASRRARDANTGGPKTEE